jgi:hypothetical protein
MNPAIVRKKALAFILKQREKPESPTRPTLHHTVASTNKEAARLAA